ncbi:MAG TPA: HAMP domain-containing sensor histidine kinase [Candidatus Obscuribacterales bacterium]
MKVLVATQQQQSPDLSRLEPGRAIGYALLCAFLLFLSFDLLESAINNQPAFTVSRSLHFVRGFVATAAGMLFVYITMHRKEIELLRLRDQFSEKLSKRTQELGDLRCDFLAVISHRMRTPILANERAEMLMKEGAFGPVTEQQSEILKHLMENNADVKRLLDTLVDILKYKNQTKDLQCDDFTLSELLNEVAASVQTQANARDIKVIVHPAVATIWGDRTEVQKLFHHILENAVKHGRSQVNVNVEANRNSTTVSITDDGKGMCQEDVSNLFDRFYQMSSTGTYAPITGIGLCLCGEIVAAHGGTIACTSNPGKSTTFTLQLPSHVA